MTARKMTAILMLLLAALVVVSPAAADDDLERRVSELEDRMDDLDPNRMSPMDRYCARQTLGLNTGPTPVSCPSHWSEAQCERAQKAVEDASKELKGMCNKKPEPLIIRCADDLTPEDCEKAKQFHREWIESVDMEEDEEHD